MNIDIHIHLAGSGCQDSGCYLHEHFRQRYTFRVLQRLLGISHAALEKDIDTTWPEQISTLLAESPIDYGVVLGFDAVVGVDGVNDWQRSQLVVPEQWVFKVCEQYHNLLPGPSINPFHRDALERLRFCVDAGAVLIKWLPSVQNISPSAKELQSFYGILREAGVPLLVHIGPEKTFKSLSPRLNSLMEMRLALEMGVKVIAAHSAAPVLGSKEEDQLPLLIEFLRRYPNLWVDNAGLLNPSRFHSVRRLLSESWIIERSLHGSDWPIPANAFYFVRQLGWRRVLSLEREANYFSRDLAIKEALGYPVATLTRATEVLANVARWTT